MRIEELETLMSDSQRGEAADSGFRAKDFVFRVSGRWESRESQS